MASERQISANRANAHLSTGPRTAEGKALVGRNATAHGLTGCSSLLAAESPQEFSEMRASVLDELAPKSPIENELADRIVSTLWRLRRIPAFEVAIIAWVHLREISMNPYSLGAPRLAGDPGAPREAGFKDRQLVLGRSLDAFLAKGVAGKLTRYETTLQRQLSALFGELRLRQAHRKEAAQSPNGLHVLE